MIIAPTSGAPGILTPLSHVKRMYLSLRGSVVMMLREMATSSINAEAAECAAVMLQVHDARIREIAIEILGNAGPSMGHYAKTIVDIARRADHDVQTTAAWALGHMRAVGARNDLTMWATHHSNSVAKHAAVRALAMLKEPYPRKPTPTERARAIVAKYVDAGAMDPPANLDPHAADLVDEIAAAISDAIAHEER